MIKSTDNWEPSEAQRKYWNSLKGYKGEKAPNWKGKAAGKAAIHDWLNALYGKPRFCEGCGDESRMGDKRYDWANISGQYKRDRDDFLRLCKSCHRRFDLTPKKKEHAIKNLYWFTKKVRVSKHGKQFKENYC